MSAQLLHTAWYTTGPAPVRDNCQHIFRRTFWAEDLPHAWEQAEDATEDGETLLGVAP